MDPSRFMTLPATITPRLSDGVDEYNNEVLVDGTPIILKGGAGAGVWKEPLDTAESGDTNSTQTERYRLFAPSLASFDALARVEVDGAEFEVDGSPEEHVSPRQHNVRYFVATMKRVR